MTAKNNLAVQPAALDRVTLTPLAAAAFPDLAPCDGVVLRIEAGWAVIKWRGIAGETRLPAGDVKKVSGPNKTTHDISS